MVGKRLEQRLSWIRTVDGGEEARAEVVMDMYHGWWGRGWNRGCLGYVPWMVRKRMEQRLSRIHTMDGGEEAGAEVVVDTYRGWWRRGWSRGCRGYIPWMVGKRMEQRLSWIRTVDGREETGAEVVVEVLVLAHLVDLLPFLVRHLFTDRLRGDLLLIVLATSKLKKLHICNYIFNS